MLRTLIYLLLTIFLITFLRGVIGLIGRAVAQLFQPNSPSGSSRSSTRGGSASGGELKQCANCGVYTAKTTALKKHSGGEDRYFCSPACRDNFQG